MRPGAPSGRRRSSSPAFRSGVYVKRRSPSSVVSGAHSTVFDAVCDVLEKELAAERAVIPGAGHSVQRTGAPFNERLEAFLSSVEEMHRAA